MKSKIITIISILIVLLSSCNMIRVNNDWPPNCCGPKEILPPGNAGRFNDSINSVEDEIAPVQRPDFVFDAYSSVDMAEPCIRESNATKQGNFDGVKSSRYFFELIAAKYKITDSDFLGYLTDNVESITFTDQNSGFISLSHPPSKIYADMMNFKALGITGGTDIFKFELDEGDDFRFKNISPISELNSQFWESHTFAATKRINGIMHTVLLWSTDKDNPFSKVVYDKKSKRPDQTKGSTDLYYAYMTGDTWSEAKKIEIENVNLQNSYEGTPFLYCLCENGSYLMFSSNRHDSTSALVEKNIIEDFDIFYVEVILDFDNQKIELLPGSKVKMFEKKTGLLSAEESVDNYFAINTEFDDRFPYVPNPINSDEDFIYFSSNRNPEKTKINGIKDSVLKSEGGYDIYRHTLGIPCTEKNLIPPKLIVNVVDAKSGEPISETLVSLVLDGTVIKTIENQNPAVFDSLKFDKLYQVYGGSKYQSGDPNACGSLLTEYFAPSGGTSDTIIQDSIIILDKKLIPIEEYATYNNGFELQSENIIKYKNFRKLEGIRRTNIKSQRIIEQVERDDKSLFAIEYIKSFHEYFESLDYSTYRGNNLEVQDNFEEVKAGRIRSEFTQNGGFYTFALKGGEEIRDTIFLAQKTDTVKCIDLHIKIKDLCDEFAAVKSPCIEIFEYSPNSDTWIDAKENLIVKNGGFNQNELIVGLVYGKKYRIKGGSNYLDTLSCNELAFYTNGDFNTGDKCYASYSLPEEIPLIPFAGCEVKSELSKVTDINTKNFAGPIIYDEIQLKQVRFKKPPCNYSFTEVFSELRRRVPYFQTGFWEVNTSGNLDNFKENSRRKSDFYWKNFEIPEEDRGELRYTTWPGAKWIELHPENSYWHFENNPNERNARKIEYERFARTVDGNLEQMRSMINDSLLKMFEYINNRENCNDCDSKKFVIEVEAWSDYRPVKYGWYMSKEDSLKQIRYAECQNILGFSPEKDSKDFFTSVEVNHMDALGMNNKNLSILRAYFGYQTLYNILMKDKSEKNRFRKYAGKILMPHHLVDKSTGKLKSTNEIDKLIKNSRIIIIAKGYDTYVPLGTAPDFTNIKDPVKKEQYEKLRSLSTFYNLDTIRTVQVRIRQLDYQEIMKQDDCCEPTENSHSEKIPFRKEEFLDEKAFLIKKD